MVEDRQRPRPRRDLGVGPQHDKVGLAAVELRERFGIVGVGYNLEAKSRIRVVQHRGQFGGKAGLLAIGVADRKGKRFRIRKQHPTGPDDGAGQDQAQHHIKQQQSAVGCCDR